MGKKEQLQQNLNYCHILLSKCSRMIQIMIKTVGCGDKADEICKFFAIDGSYKLLYRLLYKSCLIL